VGICARRRAFERRSACGANKAALIDYEELRNSLKKSNYHCRNKSVLLSDTAAKAFKP
jgi:hypothetical protein